MTQGKRMMKLAVILSNTGSHAGSWLDPDAPLDGANNIRRYIEFSQIAEAAKFDLVFLADSLAMQDINIEGMSRTDNFGVRLEPLTALSAVAMHTSRIGLVATSSTTYNEPFIIARKYASLDHISEGRAGWNLVTSSTEIEALNFSKGAHPPHAERYERAEEFIDVVRGLWDSWDDDAYLRDRESGRYFDPAGLHVLHHQGKHFQVRGPLTAMRPPQGHPIIFQAGSSGPGMDLAARTADCIFTAQPTIEGAQAFYKEIKTRAAGFGRDPDQVKIVPGFNPIVGRTRTEAEAKFQRLQEYVHPMVGLGLASMALGVDLCAYPLDGPVPDVPLTNSGQSRQAMLLRMAQEENLTLREVAMRYVNAGANSQAIGTPADIADRMEELFMKEAADGFAITPAVLPTSLSDFATLVVPELQRRGIFRKEYEGRTLRENLGLTKPRLSRPEVAA